MIASNDSCHVNTGFRNILHSHVKMGRKIIKTECLQRMRILNSDIIWGNLFLVTQAQELQHSTKEIKNFHKFSRSKPGSDRSRIFLRETSTPKAVVLTYYFTIFLPKTA